MRVHRDPLNQPALLEVRPVVSIGNFDGVHLGHRSILVETVRRAQQAGAPAGVVTFDPHPLRILAPEKAPRMLATLRQKEELFEAAGIGELFVIPFTRDFSLTAAADFIRDFLVAQLHVREVVIGRSFCFGHGRGGDLSLLEALGRELGFEAVGVPEVGHGGLPISSTRIRRALAEGDVALAAVMLGRAFGIEGIVARGSQVGRKLGFPTINIHPDNEVWPGDGVYITTLIFPSSGKRLESVTNIGTRPTLYESSATTIESFILDFDADVYGETIRLDFHERVRGEKKFASVDDLAAGIGRDVETAREWFRQHAGANGTGKP